MGDELKLIWIIFFITSCGGHSDFNKSGPSIIELVNRGDYQNALQKIDEKLKNDPKNANLNYWKAQAYSLQAKIHIYSLFPLLKMKLFHVAMDEWKSMNRYSKYQTQKWSDSLIGVEENSRLDLLRKKHEKLDKLTLEEFKYEIKLENLTFFESETYPDTNKPIGYYCYIDYSVTSIHFDNQKEKYYGYFSPHRPVPNCEKEFDRFKNEANLNHVIKKHALNLLEKKINKILAQKKQEKYLKASMAFIESIPIIRETPKLDKKQAKTLELALKQLDLVLKLENLSPRLKRNATQQMGLLAALLILNAINQSVDLTKVVGPYDLIHQTKPEKLINYYEDLKKGAHYLVQSIAFTDFAKKNKRALDFIKSNLDKAPPKLTEKQKQRLINDLHKLIRK